MLTLPPAMPIFVAVEPVDLRRGFDRLAQAARDALGHDPLRGGLFLFFNRARDRVKILFWDRTGYAILYKRLERGCFQMPRTPAAGEAGVRIEARELAKLLEGVELPPATRGADA